MARPHKDHPHKDRTALYPFGTVEPKVLLARYSSTGSTNEDCCNGDFSMIEEYHAEDVLPPTKQTATISDPKGAQAA